MLKFGQASEMIYIDQGLCPFNGRVLQAMAKHLSFPSQFLCLQMTASRRGKKVVAMVLIHGSAGR
jgi:hypothetical protein